MAIEIDKENARLNAYDWWHADVPILELKRWVDRQIEKGMNNVELKVDWGYYNDIDGIDIVAKK